MSYLTPPDIGRIPGFVGAPGPELPNTSVWAWFCCSCSHANQRPRETDTYSLCKACQHERCRDCSIRWKSRTISQEYLKRACDRTMAFADGVYSPNTYDRLKQEDEDEAAKHGLETSWGRLARETREEAEIYVGGIGDIGGIGGSGLESRESGASEESVKGDAGDVGRMVEKLVI
ncbi:hypothetical protein DL95DRAFT_407529 [Leptodontidium sp. 2 PMI_412]|nr:hypothetical protein DL95DRAFT_407529 [Leptodontidium sp. 2 PMI_412]